MIRSPLLRALGWLTVVFLVTGPIWIARAPNASGRSVIERLLGPFASTAASIQWSRADLAWSQGRHAEGYALATNALELAPSAPWGWIFLARHFARDRASLEREPDSSARREWMRAAFDVLERGAGDVQGSWSAGPDRGGELSFERGNLFVYLGSLALSPDVPADEQPWPGLASAHFEAAAVAYERAAERGHPQGRETAADARACAAEARAEGR